ncbi:MAG: hypothetical protein ACI9DF_003549 [Verrucomicrobiales bacterium]|jgi:hypothetical protein
MILNIILRKYVGRRYAWWRIPPSPSRRFFNRLEKTIFPCAGIRDPNRELEQNLLILKQF